MSWFHHRSEKNAAGASPQGAAPAVEMPQSVIREVPGVKVDLLVTLPDGGKSRSAHYARLGSDTLGRTRIGVRNLMLRLDAADDGTLVVGGDVPADAALPAFAGAAPEGATTEWSVPLADGVAIVRLTVHRENVRA